MKACAPLFFVFLLCTAAAAQTEWTPAVPLIPGGTIDTHPALVVRPPAAVSPSTEWVAFCRQTPGEEWKNIHVLQSSQYALTWPGPSVPITRDSFNGTWNDFPSLAGVPHADNPALEQLMVAWEYGLLDQTFILWSRRIDSVWSSPQPVDQHGGGDHSPCVAPYDSSFVMVWERSGTICGADFWPSIWNPYGCISAPGDTLCSNPAVCSHSYGDDAGPVMVVWESRKPGSQEHALWFSMLGDFGWTAPDTLTWTGDNLNPRFIRSGWPGEFDIFWESNRTGDWEIFGSRGRIFGGTFTWEEMDAPVSNNPAADDQSATFQLVMIPVRSGLSGATMIATAAAWTTSSAGTDSIALRSFGQGPTVYRSPQPGTIDRNPDLSSGLFLQEWVRVWAVWENNSAGRWNLYGSSVDFSVDVESDDAALPLDAGLMQNYPNPFNGETRIGYRVKGLGVSGGSPVVTLCVYDLLGRKVAALVDGPAEPGFHTVPFDASGLASGVYFYRLVSSGMTEAKTMVVLR